MSESIIKRKDRELVFEAGPFQAVAAEVAPTLDEVVRREYGRALEDFVPGTVFVHPRGFTFDRGTMIAYARTFMEANPLHLNEAYALSQGYTGLPAAAHMVMNVALSLGVQNDSEKAIANLGYWDVRFLRPVYAGDTLRGLTRVVERKDRGVGKPGIATIETLAVNQDDKVVVQYRRKVMVPRRGDGPIPDGELSAEAVPSTVAFPWHDTPKLHVPFIAGPRAAAGEALSLAKASRGVRLGPGSEAARELTSEASCFGAFKPGQIWVHRNGRTVTDEHVNWTYQVGNTHPLHFDRLYSKSLSGPMAGEPIVYGGLVFAWLLGLASRDVSENAVWELGFHAGFHTQPTFAGDTLAALTRVLSVEALPAVGAGAEPGSEGALGIVRMQLVGVKNLRAEEALARFGADLFIAEDDKKKLGKEKIAEKVFEIERTLLVRRDPA